MSFGTVINGIDWRFQASVGAVGYVPIVVRQEAAIMD